MQLRVLSFMRRWGRYGVVLAVAAAALLYRAMRRKRNTLRVQYASSLLTNNSVKVQYASSMLPGRDDGKAAQIDSSGFAQPIAPSDRSSNGAAAAPRLAAPAPTTTANYKGAVVSFADDPPINYTRARPVTSGYEPRVSTHGIPTEVSLNMLTNDTSQSKRRTKIVCTLGPACWSPEGLADLVDAGCNIGRLNFSHGDHAGHQAVLDRFRAACAQKGSSAAVLVDTKGPEIRTAMLKDGKDIQLDAGQEVTVFAAGDSYTSFEGYKDPVTGKTVIGCSYAALATTVKPGDRILFADGSVVFQVEEILDSQNVRCTCLNAKTLGQRKNGNLPGVKVNLPVLMEKDIDDLQNFACKNKVDFVAISFVQTGEDVQFVRRVLNQAGGQRIKIICKIENEAGVTNFDDILRYTDGIMVARGDLGMEMPAEKIPLAQKWMITKCNQAGKFCITATQMLESMVGNPLPTRAEMTDVANAVFDGSDCTMLSGETAGGADPSNACATMARIVATAELACDYSAYSREVSSKMAARTRSESVGLEVAAMARDSSISVVVALTDQEEVIRAIAACRPPTPVVVMTTSAELARFTGCLFGVFPFVVANRNQATATAGFEAARGLGLSAAGLGMGMGPDYRRSGARSAVVLDQNLAATVQQFR